MISLCHSILINVVIMLKKDNEFCEIYMLEFIILIYQSKPIKIECAYI